MRTGQKSGHNVSQHQGLLETFENQRHDSCYGKNQRQVFYQIRKMVHKNKNRERTSFPDSLL
jgi:ribonuclease I